MGAWHAWMSVHMCLLPTEAKSRPQFPWEFSYTSKKGCGCWELDLGPVEEQSVFLTPEPFLQSLSLMSLYQSLRNDLDK